MIMSILAISFSVKSLMIDLQSLIVFVIAVVALLVHRNRKLCFFRKLGIECMPTWPIFGALPDIMCRGILHHDEYSIRKYGRLFGTYLGNVPTLVVTDPDMIKEIFIKQFHNFPYRMQALYISKWWDNGVVMAVGDHWKYLRSLLSRTFCTSKLKQMEPVIKQSLDELVSCVDKYIHSSNMKNCVIDVRKLFGDLTLDIICQTSFGVEMKLLEKPDNEFAKYAKIVSTLNIESSAVNALPLIIKQTRSIFEYFDIDYVDKNSLSYIKNCISDIIKERKRKHINVRFRDTLEAMMNAHNEGYMFDTNNNNCKKSEQDQYMGYQYYRQRGLTDDELITNSIIMLMAGYDTTSATLCWMSFLLATNQRVQNKLRQEINRVIGNQEPTYELVNKLEYMDMFLSETLRLYPAANRTGRDAVTDTVVCGHHIPQGLSITVPIYALHRLSEYWDRPNECVPERFDKNNKQNIKPYTYMPFGVGPRACLGIKMAQMLCKQIMAKFLQHFYIDITHDQELPPVLEKSLLTKPINGMKLKVFRK